MYMAVLKFHYYSKTILEKISSYTIYNQNIFTSPSYRSTYVCPNNPGYPVIPPRNLPVTKPKRFKQTLGPDKWLTEPMIRSPCKPSTPKSVASDVPWMCPESGAGDRYPSVMGFQGGWLVNWSNGLWNTYIYTETHGVHKSWGYKKPLIPIFYDYFLGTSKWSLNKQTCKTPCWKTNTCWTHKKLDWFGACIDVSTLYFLGVCSGSGRSFSGV